jgi:hypothetical protein
MKGWELAKRGAGTLNISPETGPTGPKLPNFISIIEAYASNGIIIHYHPSGAYKERDFDQVGCGTNPACLVTIIFDRAIKSFDKNYFEVERYVAGRWEKATGIEAEVEELYKKKVLLMGFKPDTRYFLKLSTTVDYEETGTEKKFKLNSANAVLKFDT